MRHLRPGFLVLESTGKSSPRFSMRNGFLIIQILMLLWPPPTRSAPPPPSLKGEAYIVVCADTGKVLLEKNSTTPRPVASTQKLLTALLVASDPDLDGPVKISKQDTTAAPTKLYLKEGEVYPRHSLLKAMLMRSYNDAAAALARDFSGSEELFAKKMNEVAEYLGAQNSNFKNASGLPSPGQHSTARDIAIIARAAYFDPVISKIVRTPSWNFRKMSGENVLVKNTNRLLGSYQFCTGMKTGYTAAAGNCLVATSESPAGRFIAVILGSSRPAIWEDMEKILRWASGS